MTTFARTLPALALPTLAAAAAEAPSGGLWVLAPTLVMLAAAVAAAPVWPWSRQWGWPVAGIFAVAAGTAALFTTAWWFS